MIIGPGRYDGLVDRLGPVDVRAIQAWLAAIPWAAWPQQHPFADGALRPAMVNDPRWHGFGRVVRPLERVILSTMAADGAVCQQRLLSVLMPGDAIPDHVDRQAPLWWGRLHMPLATNSASRFLVSGIAYHLRVGSAYVVNTERPHAVMNPGPSPRVHLMLDIGRG